MFYAFASVEFLRRWTGLRIGVGSGEYCDAREPGLYTALEKALKSMMCCAFTGQPPGAGSGLIDEGKTMSGIQLLLDREYSVAIGRLAQAFDPSPANLALDTITDVGIGLETNHLQSEHTLRNFRRCLWLPELLDRSGWNGAAEEAKVIERTRAKLRDLLGRYVKPDDREDRLAAMRQVYARAEKALLGG
jgi:trimethylamine:corrinoid methyltransferase-like protein